MTELDTITGMFEKIVKPMFKFAVPRIGKVESVEDSENKGRVLVTIPSLGWNTNDTGAWCWASDKKSMIVPKKGDYVLVEWIDGNIDLPIYKGVPSNLKDQVVAAYEGNPLKSVIFESQNNKSHITYSEKENLMEIGNSAFQFAARIEDAIKSTAVEDTAFWGWATRYNTFNTAWIGALAALQSSGGSPGGVVAYATAMQGLLATLAQMPTELTGKITEGSDQVKVGNK